MSKPKLTINTAKYSGNIFSLVNQVAKALKQAGRADEVKAMHNGVFAAPTYPDALASLRAYVDLEDVA